MFGDGVLHILKIDTEALGFDDELLELVLEEIGFFGPGGGGPSRDNGSRTRTNLEETGVDEAGDNFVGGVGIDFEFAAESSDGWKLVSGAKLAANDGFGGGVDNLLVDGRTRGEIDVERNHWCLLCVL